MHLANLPTDRAQGFPRLVCKNAGRTEKPEGWPPGSEQLVGIKRLPKKQAMAKSHCGISHLPVFSTARTQGCPRQR